MNSERLHRKAKLYNDETQRMHVAHILAHVGDGGDWVIVREMMREFRKNGHSCCLIAAGGSDADKHGIDAPVNEHGLGILSSIKHASSIGPDVDIIHAHCYSSLLLAVFFKYLHFNRCKLVFTLHWNTPSPKRVLAIKNILLRLVDVIHVYSSEMKEVLSRQFPAGEDKIRMIYVGSNPNVFIPCNADFIKEKRKSLGLHENDFVILYVGRLAPEKNVETVIDYMASRRYRSVKLVIAGDGESREKLEKRVQDLNVSNDVSFLGRVDEIETLYPIGDVLVLPSTSLETFGLVVIEAALCGVPAIRSNLPGASDQIIDGETGFVFPVHDTNEFFCALDFAVNGKINLPVAGSRARVRAIEKFTTTKMYEGLLEAYST